MPLRRRISWPDKRVVVASLLVALLTLTFWTGSRYPALDAKAATGVDTELAGLGFDTLVEVDTGTPWPTRMVYTTANWLYTNRQGMTFGVLVAALLMTLVPLLGRRRLHNRLANTVMGTVIGTPLGVCVNCATPVAQGIYSAGGRVEVALATMMSAPTLNLVVLTMLFALFPLHVAAIKVGLTVAVVFFGIPLLTRLLPIPAVAPSHDRGIQRRPPGRWWTAPEAAAEDDTAETWLQALMWVGRQFLRTLWYITRTAVPLMILAGALGSALVAMLPFDALGDLAPQAGRAQTVAIMGSLALFGVFLPVPMAFDVIVSAALFQAGLPLKYAAVLLFTLGIFSIYPFFMVWRTMSRPAAVAIFVALTGLGFTAGATSHIAGQRHQSRQQELLLHAFDRTADVDPLMPSATPARAAPVQTLLGRLQRHALRPERFDTIDGIAVTSLPFRGRAVRRGTAFREVLGNELGLDTRPSGSLVRQLDPFVSLRGIAAGDVHGDGWTDLLVASEAELALYANRAGRGYVRQPIEMPALPRAYITSAALVDLNNDGWLDVFFATYRAGNHVIYNHEGVFPLDNWSRLPNQPDAVAAAAAAFGDVDRDGDLDLVLGNLTGTPFVRRGPRRGETSPSPSSSDNALLIREEDTWQVEDFDEISAETWSTLLSDIDNDGRLDLLVGNDLEPPDYVYLGRPDDALHQVTRADGLIPYTTHMTMSVASADIDNDLVPELYFGHVSPPDGRPLSPARLCDDVPDTHIRRDCEREYATRDAVVQSRIKRDAFLCRSLDDPQARRACVGLNALWAATLWQRSRAACEIFPETWDIASFLCRHSFADHPTPDRSQLESAIPQALVPRGNVLLVRQRDGSYADRAGAMGVADAGWTWNAKFADLDNDQWQDLYVVNGQFYGTRRSQNYFFHNRSGRRFAEKSEAYGLDSWLDTVAYTTIDLDHDGDLDIVAVPAVGPLLVYVNELEAGNAIAFELRDALGNRFGIGSTIRIFYGDGRRQMRELQAGGGYQSHDAPIVHFGLGPFDEVDRVDVLWSTGERSTLDTPFPAGARYVLTRR